MKKLILLFCFLVLASTKIYSQIIFMENFQYPAVPPTILSTTAPWEPLSSAGIAPILVDVPGGLTYPMYAGSGIGNAVTLQDLSGEDDSARFNLGPIPTSGSVYASFMLSAVSATPTGDYFFALLTEVGPAQVLRVYARSSGIGFNLGIQKSGTSTINYTTQVYSFLATYLVVAKYTFNPLAADDAVSLFVFPVASPPPSTEPAPTLGPLVQGGTDAADLSAVLLRQGSLTGSAEVIIDGIYVSTIYDNTVLPVELSSFSSLINGREVTLNWSTATETNNSAFEIERSSNGAWSKVGSVTGAGTSTTPQNYSFADRGLATGNYSYRLKQIDFNGNFEYFNLNNEVVIGLPVSYSLSQNYPNPFNPSTKINYDLPFDGKVSVKLFDMSGKEVSSLVNEVKAAGYYTINFNATNLSSGIYFYTINADNNGQNFVSTKKMMLVK